MFDVHGRSSLSPLDSPLRWMILSLITDDAPPINTPFQPCLPRLFLLAKPSRRLAPRVPLEIVSHIWNPMRKVEEPFRALSRRSFSFPVRPFDFSFPRSFPRGGDGPISSRPLDFLPQYKQIHRADRALFPKIVDIPRCPLACRNSVRATPPFDLLFVMGLSGPPASVDLSSQLSSALEVALPAPPDFPSPT